MQFAKPLLRLPIRFCPQRLADEVNALGQDAWTPHPQGFPGNDAVILVSPGGELTDRLRGPMAPSIHLRNSPYMMAIMGELGAVWGRSRLMRLAPGAEVPGHVDLHYYWRTHIRIHIPIITSPEVIFTCGGESVHMSAGECWVFDSFQMHDVQNRGSTTRVHLVLDTVGGDRLWDLIDAASCDIQPPDSPWQPESGSPAALTFERVNAPKVISPWEIRCHVDYLASSLCSAPEVPAVLKRLDKFIAGWLTTWSQFGESDEGVETYRGLVERARSDLHQLGYQGIMLRNDVPLAVVLDAMIFKIAVAAPPPDAIQQSSAMHGKGQ